MKKRVLIPVITGLLLTGAGLSSCGKDPCGPKGGDCICTMEYAPVCGSDGKTYGNACEARCNGVASWTEGECPGK